MNQSYKEIQRRDISCQMLMSNPLALYSVSLCLISYTENSLMAANTWLKRMKQTFVLRSKSYRASNQINAPTMKFQCFKNRVGALKQDNDSALFALKHDNAYTVCLFWW